MLIRSYIRFVFGRRILFGIFSGESGGNGELFLVQGLVFASVHPMFSPCLAVNGGDGLGDLLRVEIGLDITAHAFIFHRLLSEACPVQAEGEADQSGMALSFYPTVSEVCLIQIEIQSLRFRQWLRFPSREGAGGVSSAGLGCVSAAASTLNVSASGL